MQSMYHLTLDWWLSMGEIEFSNLTTHQDKDAVYFPILAEDLAPSYCRQLIILHPCSWKNSGAIDWVTMLQADVAIA